MANPLYQYELVVRVESPRSDLTLGELLFFPPIVPFAFVHHPNSRLTYVGSNEIIPIEDAGEFVDVADRLHGEDRGESIIERKIVLTAEAFDDENDVSHNSANVPTIPLNRAVENSKDPLEIEPVWPHEADPLKVEHEPELLKLESEHEDHSLPVTYEDPLSHSNVASVQEKVNSAVVEETVKLIPFHPSKKVRKVAKVPKGSQKIGPAWTKSKDSLSLPTNSKKEELLGGSVAAGLKDSSACSSEFEPTLDQSVGVAPRRSNRAAPSVNYDEENLLSKMFMTRKRHAEPMAAPPKRVKHIPVKKIEDEESLQFSDGSQVIEKMTPKFGKVVIEKIPTKKVSDPKLLQQPYVIIYGLTSEQIQGAGESYFL